MASRASLFGARNADQSAVQRLDGGHVLLCFAQPTNASCGRAHDSAIAATVALSLACDASDKALSKGFRSRSREGARNAASARGFAVASAA
jgi:hypothetical protein